jgi:hypothetical protein
MWPLGCTGSPAQPALIVCSFLSIVLFSPQQLDPVQDGRRHQALSQLELLFVQVPENVGEKVRILEVCNVACIRAAWLRDIS